jgi:hypothetical protein
MLCVGACSISDSRNADGQAMTGDDPANEITGYIPVTDGGDPEPIYANPAARGAYVRKLHGQCLVDMARKDPVLDAKAALVRHDYRLWGAQNSEDWGYRAPGLKCMFEKLDVQPEVKNYFTEEGDGGGDLGIQCAEKLLQYETTYNRYLAAHLPNFKQRLGCRSEFDPPRSITTPQ